MLDGWIQVAAATPRLRVADCAYNASETLALMRQADEAGVRLAVFPELGLTGYTCGDLFLQESLLEGARQALETLREESRSLNLLTLVGLPLEWGGKLYNCAAALYRGEILGFVPKSHLPNYGEFYELRHFHPAPAGVADIPWGTGTVPFGRDLLFACREVPGFVVGVEICEDLWVPEPPSTRHALAGALILANLSASDETVGKDAYRRTLVTGQSARLCAAYIYADAGEGESTTDMVFAGHDLIAENGILLAESRPFTTGLTVGQVDVSRLQAERRRMNAYPPRRDAGYRQIPFSMPPTETPLTRPVDPAPFIPADAGQRAQRCEAILSMQAAGLAKRLEHSHAKTAVLGISGGLDSCLALLVTARAMDRLGRSRKDILAVTMPCFGTTVRTRGNAEILSQAVGATLRTVDIARAVELHFDDIGHDPQNRDVTYENSQARERTQILMDLANETNGLVVGTGDLSELALGWATYNGDHMSMYGVNASVPKTLIRHIVRYAADTVEDASLREVLLDILDTPVSPELLPAQDGEIAQRTEDIVGPYQLHDFFLYYCIRWGFAPRKIYRLAQAAFTGVYDDSTILHWLRTFYRRFFAQQFKRSCLPDGPKIGSVSLSPRGDWRMPSDAAASLWLAEAEALQPRNL